MHQDKIHELTEVTSTLHLQRCCTFYIQCTLAIGFDNAFDLWGSEAAEANPPPLSLCRITTICPADQPSPLIIAKSLKQRAKDPGTDTKLVTFLLPHTMPNNWKPGQTQLIAFSVVRRQGQKYWTLGSRTPTGNPRPCTRHGIGTALWRFLSGSRKGHFAGALTGFGRFQQACLLRFITRRTL